MHYGERLKLLRSAMGLSQQELARKLNLNRSTYTRYELRQTQPDFGTLQKIADFFNVTFDYLLGRSDHPNRSEEGAIPSELTEKDEKDIAKRMDKLREDLKNDKESLSFSGEPLSEDAIESLLEALEFAEHQIARINKNYIPKKSG